MFFAALTALLTFPQVLALGTSVPLHQDPYLSIWRLGWVAHALKDAPAAFFDANIFYPAPHTLAYADATALEGVIAAPLLWARVNPVLIYNLLLLCAFALSGYTAFLLARELTGSTPAASGAGIIYAFAPNRFCHYMHLELQVVFWIPLALLLLHRIVTGGELRHGLLLGLTVAGQLLSAIYLGIYAIAYFVVLTPLLLAATDLRRTGRLLMAVAVGAVLTAVLIAPYLIAYQRAAGEVGPRGLDEVQAYSARLQDYLHAPPINRFYSWTANTKLGAADEMNLFPGVLACLLALVGVAAGRGPIRFAYLAGLLFSVEMTQGANSGLYLWLYAHFPPFQALRSPARADTLVMLSLSVLAAYGLAALLHRVGDRRNRLTLAIVAIGVLSLEYASAPVLERAPRPSRIDGFLARQPPAVVVQLPIVVRGGFWGSYDAVYMAQGIGHFQKMLNGYSGHATAAFYKMREEMAAFPDQRSIDFLRAQGVTFVVVRAGLYDPRPRAALLEKISQTDGLALEAMWTEGPQGAEAVYRVTHPRLTAAIAPSAYAKATVDR